MPEYNKHIDTFPLEHLFRRLELAGFQLSPADRLRALRILGGPAKAYLEDPAALKQLLAPVLVRSEAEQLKFYEIFDQYYLDISGPWAPPVLEGDGPEWWKWLLLLPMLALLFYAYYALTQQEVGQEQLTVYIDGPDYGIPGDTVRFENKTNFPDERGQWRWRWSYIDVASQREEAFDTSALNWAFVVPGIDSGAYLRELRLQVWPPDVDTIYETRKSFAVFCPNAPDVTAIQANTQLEAKQEETFQAVISDELAENAANWFYEWDFGDGLQDEGRPETTHRYAQNGQYTVRLTVTDTSANGFCSTTQMLEVKVGREQAFLPTSSLRPDRLSLLATWGWGFYILLAALGLGLLYYWVRWLTRKKRQPLAEQLQRKKQEEISARFAHSDKAPYFIPLRNQNSYIIAAGIQLRLADALRLRQEGLRKELDLDGTLHTTIEKGGFPAIQYRYATQPSEYLCLIDEQSRASHLGHLFRYLADSLKGQDVHLEVYYYRQHFNRFWNSYYPQGRTLDQLQRAYGSHRLLVMGDLHDLLNPYAQKSPNLRSAYANVLRQWPLRLLLTPVPPISWSYREKLLARIFSVFPADSAGLAGAALHIENDGELLPDGNAYDRWQAAQISVRQDSDTEHRNWRRWRFIEEYLNTYDDKLVRWFRALAVFPIPSWEMTIAIGRALGADITYDNLLRLARIPVLQGDRFDERLRREMIADLHPEDERKARAAVQKELSAVRLVSEGSHAHRDLESALAVQDFALAPMNEDHQQTMRFMLQHDLLTPAQEADLERIVNRVSSRPAQKTMEKMAPPALSLREWLEDNWVEEVEEEKQAPQEEDRSDLRRALWLTAAYLILLLLGWQLGGSDRLYQMVFSEPQNQSTGNEELPLRNYFFVQEAEVIDSAIIYNNQGVEQAAIATLGDTTAALNFRNAIRTASSFLHSDGESFAGIAITYSLANANLSKLYLNAAVQELNGYLSDSLGQAVLPEALGLLDAAYRSDSTLLDVWHARGVVHYYAGSPEDSSLYYYNLLDSLDYFQTLNYSPNLETLIGRERSRIVEVTPTHIGDRVLTVTVNYYVDPSIYPAGGELLLSAQGNGTQPAEISRSIPAGRTSVSIRMEPPRQNPGELEQLSITLVDPASENQLQALEQPFAHSWKQPSSRPQSPPPQQVRARAFRLEGEVIDATTRGQVSNFSVMLQQRPNRATRSPLQFNGQPGKYGDFYIEGELLTRDVEVFDLIIDAPGYKRFEREISTQKELLRANPFVLSSPIRLLRDIPRPRMELISAGGFMMGDETGEYSEDERPVHEVSLNSFYMGIYEVTFAEYDLFCEATGRPKPDDNGWGRSNRPVINVSWMDAVEYCNWLSEQHGYQAVYDINPKTGSADLNSTRRTIPNGYRLPTEAEWEYAARGGVMLNKSHIYAGGTSMNTLGWYDRNSNDQTHPVGQLRPNNAGTFDMSGNVWEWCYDWFGGYSADAQRNPFGPDYGSHRVVRGGAWIQQDVDCRVSVRQFRRPSEKTVYLGFRLVRGQ